MRPLTAIALAVLAGCATVDSDTVTTKGIYADLWAIAEGDGTSRAVASLRVGGELSNTFVELTGDDVLTANRDGEEPIVMFEQALLGARTYRADFDDDTPDVDIHVAFTRTIDDGAPDSVMSIPQPFEVGALNANYSRGTQDIVLTWDNTQAEEIQVYVEGSCIVNDYGQKEPDTGSKTFPAGSIHANDGEEAENCDITFSVWRSRPGSVDPGYGEGGQAWGHQLRQVGTLSIP